MSMMFVSRNPTSDEENLLRAYLSSFRDGSGSERERDGTTRAGWRQIERVFAELLAGDGGENKDIFDVVAATKSNPNTYYGFSIKSKELSARNFAALPTTGRVYMEIANSPAKFWDALVEKHDLTEENFRKCEFAEEFGTCIIDTVEEWHHQGKFAFESAHHGKTLDLEKSCYLCVSYSKDSNPSARKYQVHAFDLSYTKSLEWKFKSENCLSGIDTATQESVIDWYALSGGQLKYYPKATEAKFQTSVFHLATPPTVMSIHEKAAAYFPDLVSK